MKILGFILIGLYLCLVTWAFTYDYKRKPDPLSYCKVKCSGHLNTILRYGNTTNIYSCGCDNK